MPDDHDLAELELLGALTYGQLRAFEITAHSVRFAPDARLADRMAEFAAREHGAYVRLRSALVARTDLPAAVIDRQKPRFDAYFDGVPMTDWLSAVAFFAVGLPLAADFIREIAPALEPDLAATLVGALAERDAFESFALDEFRERLGDEQASDRARHLAAEILGSALTGFQGALADTDALKILFADAAGTTGESPEGLVKRMAITVLEGHRRRMHALGLEDLL